MLECIVSLPNSLFFNTGISTYIWILNNNKTEERQGKVQLINGSNFFNKLRKNLGDKSKEISKEGRNKIIDTYKQFKESDICYIFNNSHFGYTKVTVEQPLEKDGIAVTTKQGKVKPDTKKRDYERIPLSDDIEDYFEREVKPHLPDSWIDESKNKVGYEINFTKYFYKYKPLRSMSEITQDLLKLEEVSENLLKEVVK